jgi:S-adenosylmethionine hydrolase
VVIILFFGFCIFGRCKLEKTRIGGEEQQVTIELVDGMGSVMDEGDLEGKKMQQVQASVEDGALAPCNVKEKQVQMGVEVGETSTTNLTIEVDLQKTIEMIVEQENVVIALAP